MNLFADALAWIFEPAHWSGANGIPVRVAEHLFYTFLSVVIAGIIAIALGLYIGHTGRLRGVAIAVTGALRALPTLGLLSLLAISLGGIRFAIVPSIIVLVILAIPPLLAGAYSGVESVDSRTVDAARAVGMNEWQILFKVEFPLALPIVIGGIRSAFLQVIATATVAAFVGLGGLGRYLIDAIPVRNYAMLLAGAIIIIVLALVFDGLFALVQRFVLPRGVRAIRSQGSSRIKGTPRTDGLRSAQIAFATAPGGGGPGGDS